MSSESDVGQSETDAALAAMEEEADSLVGPSLMRLTSGLPRHELKLMAKEARECEKALMKEIRILEEYLGLKPSMPPEEEDEEEEEDKDKSGSEKKGGGETDEGDKKQPASNSGGNNDDASSSDAAMGIFDVFGGLNYFTSVEAMLTSELTPPDRFFTASALLGRLREPLDIPPPPNSSLAHAKQRAQSNSRKPSNKKGGGSGSGSNRDLDKQEAERKQKRKLLDKQKALLALESNPMYRQEHTDTTALLALWKRISSHRTAAVFRRPVNAREAPGYSDRILFPMDLSLIRKMITAGMIVSFADLHERVGLICHNCVKFNGRESDYGVVTREFESYVDDSIMAAVATASEAAAKSGDAFTGSGRSGKAKR